MDDQVPCKPCHVPKKTLVPSCMKSGLALLLSLPIRSYQSIPPLKFWTISYLRAAIPEFLKHQEPSFFATPVLVGNRTQASWRSGGGDPDKNYFRACRPHV